MTDFKKWFAARARNPDKITIEEAFDAGASAQQRAQPAQSVPERITPEQAPAEIREYAPIAADGYADGWNACVKSILAAAPKQETQPTHSVPDGWMRAIDEALVTAHIGIANAHDTYEQAKAKLDSLIGFHVDVGTDPAVNGGWKLMPVEPTREIYECFTAYDGTSYSNPFDFDDFIDDYRLALEAASEAKP